MREVTWLVPEEVVMTSLRWLTELPCSSLESRSNTSLLYTSSTDTSTVWLSAGFSDISLAHSHGNNTTTGRYCTLTSIQGHGSRYMKWSEVWSTHSLVYVSSHWTFKLLDRTPFIYNKYKTNTKDKYMLYIHEYILLLIEYNNLEYKKFYKN